MLCLCCAQITTPAYDRERLSGKIEEAPIIIRATVGVEDAEYRDVVSRHRAVKRYVPSEIKDELVHSQVPGRGRG